MTTPQNIVNKLCQFYNNKNPYNIGTWYKIKAKNKKRERDGKVNKKEIPWRNWSQSKWRQRKDETGPRSKDQSERRKLPFSVHGIYLERGCA